MPELDLWFFMIAIPAVTFAGFSKGGFGGGVAFAGSSILAIVLEPGQALALMLPLLMLVDVATLKPYWKRWNVRDSWVLILGGLPGVALGAWLYKATDADLLRLLIGGISVGFVIWHLSQSRSWVRGFQQRLSASAGVFAGLVAGFTSFVSHAGGPPAAVYLLSQRLGKTEFQASTVIVFWVINFAKAIPYAYLGLFSLETLWADFLLAPFALLGAWLGVRAHWRVPERLFFSLAYLLLTITGCKLIWDALS
ncbi:sulfite exporter TauE/SafE family protein [Ruegeria jejuensis]|uniref:sulfite exporter TauE/SafE family protein n=1 Tax=Ruegeria jejuensis TaxID=3233338 RepID=UPI00355C5A89